MAQQIAQATIAFEQRRTGTAVWNSSAAVHRAMSWKRRFYHVGLLDETPRTGGGRLLEWP
jgi:hypothetical protein